MFDVLDQRHWWLHILDYQQALFLIVMATQFTLGYLTGRTRNLVDR